MALKEIGQSIAAPAIGAGAGFLGFKAFGGGIDFNEQVKRSREIPPEQEVYLSNLRDSVKFLQESAGKYKDSADFYIADMMTKSAKNIDAALQGLPAQQQASAKASVSGIASQAQGELRAENLQFHKAAAMNMFLQEKQIDFQAAASRRQASLLKLQSLVETSARNKKKKFDMFKLATDIISGGSEVYSQGRMLESLREGKQQIAFQQKQHETDIAFQSILSKSTITRAPASTRSLLGLGVA